MKNENFKTGLFFAVAAILSLVAVTLLLSACSESTSTAGVLTETESGQTASAEFVTVTGVVNDMDGQPVARARVYLTDDDSVNHHTFIIDSTLSDDNGFFMFDTTEDWQTITHGTYNILVKAKQGEDSITAFTYQYNRLDKKDSLFFEMTAGKPATILMYINKNSSLYESETYADSLCFGGTFVCETISSEDIEKGFVKIENVPGGTLHEHYIWFGDKLRKSLWSLDIKPEETFHLADKTGGYATDSLEFALPASALNFMDSLGLDPTLESLLLPIETPDQHIYHSLIDGEGNEISLAQAEGETDSTHRWIELNSLGKEKQTLRYLNRGYISGNSETLSQVPYLYATAEPGTTFEDTLFKTHHESIDYCLSDNCTTLQEYYWQENSFGVSFWINTEDSSATAPRTIFATGNDTLGFTIAQCENDTKSICTKIYTGIDSLKNATYGKSKIFDGKKHHVSMVIYEKHLNITIDGESVHDTDLKTAEEFYGGIYGIRIGDFALENFVIFRPGSNIRRDDEKDWSRLKAWLKAFYELQLTAGS